MVETRDPRSTARKKPEEKFQARKAVIVFLVVLTVVCFFWRWAASPTSSQSSPERYESLTDSAAPDYLALLLTSKGPAPNARRPLYPYSVIPYGVASGQELQAALHRDSVAAAHYSGFNPKSAHVVRLAKERQVFVSYRLGNHIYWTSKKVTLHAGETLLTDGTHLVRTRCGNRISNFPVLPISPREPPEQVLRSPVVQPRPILDTDPYSTPPTWMDDPEPSIILSYGAVPPPSSPPSSAGFYPVPVAPICCTGNSYPPSPGPPPVATPEPSSLILVLSSVVGIYLFLKLRRN